MYHPAQPIRHELKATRWPSAEEAASSLLFSPLQMGPIELKSRTWVPAMVPWRATDEGFVTPQVLAWYERFAQGQPGAIVVEATGVRDVPSGPLLRIGHERFLPGLRELVQTVKRASLGQTRLFIQIIDFLAVKRRPTPEKFFTRFWQISDFHRRNLEKLSSDPGLQNADEETIRDFLLRAPDTVQEMVLAKRELEALRFGYRESVNDTHLPHIAELPLVLPDIFAAAATRAREAGFDGVELHYAHAYTMASFLSRLNSRNDGYGNSRENRVRLPLEVYQAVRAKVGQSFPVGVRFLGDEVISGGSRIEDAIYYGTEFAKAGFNFLSVSKGGKFEDAKQPKIGQAVYPYTGESGFECMPPFLSDNRGPFGRNVPLAGAIRQAVHDVGLRTPVITAGGIATFELAEQILCQGHADIIAAARQSLADPDWFLKMRSGQGVSIRRCNFTNYCEALDQMHKQVTCKLWDRQLLDEKDVTLTTDGRRRLLAPAWTGEFE